MSEFLIYLVVSFLVAYIGSYVVISTIKMIKEIFRGRDDD